MEEKPKLLSDSVNWLHGQIKEGRRENGLLRERLAKVEEMLSGIKLCFFAYALASLGAGLFWLWLKW